MFQFLSYPLCAFAAFTGFFGGVHYNQQRRDKEFAQEICRFDRKTAINLAAKGKSSKKC